jgi:hypothetical protein
MLESSTKALSSIKKTFSTLVVSGKFNSNRFVGNVKFDRNIFYVSKFDKVLFDHFKFNHNKCHDRQGLEVYEEP